MSESIPQHHRLPERPLGARQWRLKPIAVATLPVPGWECFFGRNDCTMHDLVFWVWILWSDGMIGLIDTGLPKGADLDALNRANQKVDEASVFTVHRQLEDVLVEEGVEPEQIDFALVSQMVTYSTGGILLQNLPRAKVYMAWAGMQELLLHSPGHPPREFYLTGESWNACRQMLLQNRLIFATGAEEVAPGVIFEPTGGHHPGSAGVRVQTSQGVVGILETAFLQRNVEECLPIGIAEDATRCREVISRYRKECDLTIAGHEPAAPVLLESFLKD